MLSKQQRLDRKQFTAFFKIGRRKHGEYLTIIFLPSQTLKAAVVVGKKVFNKAHDRNGLRRRIYAWLFDLSLKGITGTVVVIVKSTVKALTKAQTKALLIAEIEAATVIR